VPIELNRVDDRLIHGQVVVGWGQPLGLALLLLVDDVIAASEWEQELYRMGVPPEMEVRFASVDDAARQWASWNADPRPAVLLTASIDAMVRLAAQVPALKTVNLGGVHQGAGRAELLRYLYLTPAEAAQLSSLASRGVEITARDVPTASPVPLAELLAKQGSA
jgi:PTS system mannose-specific IIB component/fructoselysine and glucoselysine-specific PTS system IIB component